MNVTKKEEQIIAYLAEDGFYKLLDNLMEQQNISPKKLSDGLCSESMLSRARQGMRMPRKMLRDRLLGRLGISDERCENLLDYEEYVKWETRRDIVKAVSRRESTKARKLLADYAGSRDFKEDIEQQFYHAMEIQLMLHEGTPADELAERLEIAVKLTIPNIDECRICDLQLDLQELNLVLEYEKYKHPDRLTERCEEILKYIEESPWDERSRAKIYPKVALYLCELQSKDGSEASYGTLKVANYAVEYLRNTQKNHYLWELLSVRETTLEQIMKKLKTEGEEKRAEALLPMYWENADWKNAIETIYGMVEYPIQTDDFCYLYMQQEVYCVKEVMRNRREMLGISRAKLNAGSFDERTLVRLETGKRNSRLDTVKTLFARLNLSGELQRVDVVTDSKEARDLVEKLVKYSNNFELENEKETLQELEQYLDMNIPQNRQFVKAQQAIILHGGDKNNREKAFELMKEALECTISLEKIKESEKRYLTGEEIRCLYNMAIYSGSNVISEYHKILLEVCKKYEEDDVIEEHIALYSWVMTMIARTYSNMGQHESAIELSEKVMKTSLECSRLALVEQNMDCVSWNRERLQKKGTSRNARYDRQEVLEVCVALSRFKKETHREQKYVKKLKDLA